MNARKAGGAEANASCLVIASQAATAASRAGAASSTPEVAERLCAAIASSNTCCSSGGTAMTPALSASSFPCPIHRTPDPRVSCKPLARSPRYMGRSRESRGVEATASSAAATAESRSVDVPLRRYRAPRPFPRFVFSSLVPRFRDVPGVQAWRSGGRRRHKPAMWRRRRPARARVSPRWPRRLSRRPASFDRRSR